MKIIKIFLHFWFLTDLIITGDKAKGWISKRVLRENKARQIFRKLGISYTLIRTRVWFWKVWLALFSSNTRFESRPFALLPTLYNMILFREWLLIPFYRWPLKHEQWWECKFIGEGIIDQGNWYMIVSICAALITGSEKFSKNSVSKSH